MPRPVVISTRRPARVARTSYTRIESPASTTTSTRSPFTQHLYPPGVVTRSHAPYGRRMDLAELTAAVDRAFLTTAAGLEPWPDPRPDGRSPAEEEYSRCLDPGKYRLVLARADAWATALVECGLGREAEVPASALREVRNGRRPARAVLVEPLGEGAEDAAPLLFLSWDEQEDAAAKVEVHLHDLGLLVVAAPVCGCDACDNGSEPQLRALDQAVGAAVAGDWRVRARQVARLVEEARVGRSSYPVVRPGRWW
jgi:hypothetical protein